MTIMQTSSASRHQILRLCALLAVAVFPALLSGQAPTGNIEGRVTDTTGSIIAGAEVVAVNPAKGFQAHATTDTEGTYRFLYLDPAIYTVTFSKPGFQTLQRSAIQLRSNDALSVDAQLAVGEVVERMEVTAAAPLLDAITSNTGTTVSGQIMNALPTPQRKTWQVTYLMPGANVMQGYHITGQRDRGIAYTLDGLSGLEPVRGGIGNDTTVSTTQDAVEEVKLVTTVLPAEYGHSAGGMLSTTFKSGTNQLHVLAEDRYVNNDLKHRDYFQLARTQTPFVYHELSSLVSGPLYIPKLYDGRNRTFFLFGYARHHEKNDQQVFSTVPTPDMLNGDFSFAGLGYPIYDPAVTRKDANGTWVSDPFPGNNIPQSRFDPPIKKFLSYQPWKVPNNLGGSGYIDRTGPHSNYGAYNHKTSYRSRWDTKIDHVFSEKDRMFGRYSQVRKRGRTNEIGLNWQLLDGNFVEVPDDQVNAVVSETHIFSANVINEFRLGANRRKDSRTPQGYDEDWGGQLGIPGISPVTFPSLFDSTGAAFYGASMPGGRNYDVTESNSLQDNVTFIVGQHTFKAGYELLRTRANTSVASLPAGVYRFGGTGFPFTPNTGNDFAAFLLGSVVRADFNTALANWLPRWWGHALFFQDDWRVTKKLTLNLGVRWSYESPFTTKYGQQSQFDPQAVDPVTGLTGGIVHRPGLLAKRDMNNFQPRAGLAYKFNDKVVFRGGFGVSTIDLYTAGLNQNFDEYFTAVTKQQPSGDPRPAFFISQGPGPTQYTILPDGTSPFVGVNYSSRSATWYDPNMRDPYSMNWNGTIQYQLGPSWLLDMSYQGSAGVGLLNAWNINAIPLDISRDPVVLNSIYKNTQAYVPWTQFGAVSEWSNFGHSTYHSGTIKIEKRFSRGFSLMSFYTKSKTLDEADADGAASGITYYNRSLEKGRAGFDVSNRWVTYGTYQLPIGRGRSLMNRGGVLDYLFGGWNISGIQTFQSGTPVTFTMAGSPNHYLPGTARANQLLPNDQIIVNNYQIGARFDNTLKNPMWNIQGFAYPAAFTAGTVGRNTIQGPGLNWTQASISKNIKFREKYNLDLRFDAQNIFKSPNFANPNSAVNLTNPAAFGKPTATVAGIDSLGGRFVGYVVVKLSF